MRKRHLSIMIVCVVAMMLVVSTGCSVNGTTSNKDTGYVDKTLKMAYSCQLIKGTEETGSVYYTAEADHYDLAEKILNIIEQFDAENGGTGAHSESPSNLEKLFIKLRIDLDDDARFEVHTSKLDKFAISFEQSIGKLTDSYDCGTPDIINDDDDLDGFSGGVDDDDDNDGCMDWDEADGNVGGSGNTYETINLDCYNKTVTGKGRGIGKGDDGMGGPGMSDNYEKPGPNDSKNPANGSDTSHLDNGE